MNDADDARRNSWNRRLARLVLAPFVCSRLTPNIITTLRVLTGVAACLCFARGDDDATVLGGVLWVISAFLDRCDGEFARMTGQSSALGKLYDFTSDVLINGGVFLAIGIGLDKGQLAGWGVLVGGVASLAVVMASLLAEYNERDMPPGKKTFNGVLGFEFDDFIYGIAVFAWCDVLHLLLAAGAIGASLATLVIAGRVAGPARNCQS